MTIAHKDDPDFDHIKKHMEAQGFEWCGVAFRKWGHIAVMTYRRQVDYRSFEDAAAEWHREYVAAAQEINHSEMWRI